MKLDQSKNDISPKDSARNAPLESGVYIMKDDEGKIIYVGKAKVLKNRLLSYFSGEKDIKTRTLVRHISSIETITVADEYEALLLENTLIKQHSPKYNINLKDGKSYPVIRLTRPPFPKIFRTRHIVEDGSEYFGPYPNVGMVDSMMEIVAKNFPLRKCRTMKKRSSPCMYYHIGRCAAPCCGKISEADYDLAVDRVRKLLLGENGPLLLELNAEMHSEAALLRFENAARIRNAIRAIEGLNAESSVVDFDPEGRDYIAWAGDGFLVTYSVFSMREGKLTGRELFRTRSASDEGDSFETFVMSYYSAEHPPPPLIYIHGGDSALIPELQKWFRSVLDADVSLLTRDKLNKHHTAILAMAAQNAREDIVRRVRERGAGPALDELREALGLSRRPERIEGFDIAQLDGKYPVASLVSFKDGVPDRKNYRHFRLRSVIGIVDDFQSMREAVHRRYSRLLKENRELPDLILIDGGIGQVNAACGVLKELALSCDVAGLAKRDEELWLPGAKSPLRLSRRSEALRLLQHVRDETHRFATGLNQRLRSKSLALENLESVDGIGPSRAAALMRHFGSLDALAAASPQDVQAACSLSESAALAVRAAARLALEKKSAQKLRSGRRNPAAPPGGDRAASLAAQAAEPDKEYPEGADSANRPG